MDQYENDVDVLQRFQYLFKPATTLLANFQIDLVDVLKQYEQDYADQDSGFNFAAAATIIQGSTGVYSRKVDVLHKMATDFHINFAKAPEKEKKKRTKVAEKGTEANPEEESMEEDHTLVAKKNLDKNKAKSRYEIDPNCTVKEKRAEDQEKSVASEVVPFESVKVVRLSCDRPARSVAPCNIEANGMVTRDPNDGLCIFDRFCVDDSTYTPCYISESREYQLVFNMPSNMMPLMEFEKRKLPLRPAFNSRLYNEADDFRIIRDIVHFDNALYQNIGGELCYDLSEQGDPCAVFNHRLRQFLNAPSSQSVLPSDCKRELEASRRESGGNLFSMNLVEICRRLSEDPQASLIIDRIGDNITLDDLKSLGRPSYEPFEGVHMNQREDVGASVASSMDMSLGGPPDFDFQPNDQPEEGQRRSARLASVEVRLPRLIENVDLEDDGEFKNLDLYTEMEYKNKPFKVAKNIDVRAPDLQRKRDNFIKRKAEKEGIKNIDSLNNFMRTNFFRKTGKYRGDPVLYTVNHQTLPAIASCIRNEKIRRNTIKLETKKLAMENVRRVLRNRQFEHVKRTQSQVINKLEEDLAKCSILEEEEMDEWDGDANVPVTVERATPAPLGDVIPDNFANFDSLNASIASRVRSRRRSTGSKSVDIPMEVPQVPDIQDISMNMPFVAVHSRESIGHVVQVYLSQQWQLVLKNEPARHAKFAVWEKKVLPILNNLRDDFMADEYGRMILNAFEGEIGRKIRFSDFAFNNPVERSRFLLTILMLANRDTLEVYPIDTQKSPQRHKGYTDTNLDGQLPQDFEIELLKDAAWYGDALNQSGLF
ncbi:hypothetical protein FO519_000673 [Halicephalobus sp. NKZ332]|nr:hypothetical protein FO519_000673 [Halicephalobus sp. NKZ332]